MNSLLQTLFMTPELRAQLYQWTYEPDRHGLPEDCIPLQLQLLFARLHLSQTSLRTTNLTKSFGWNDNESFQQHDTQEFCRVLFDAIEQSVSGTSLSGMIPDLFQSQLESFVRCQFCQHESCTADFFLDWSLTVRNPFEGIFNGSVEEALENYLRAEVLSGDNQYFCSNCEAKRDAIKGFRISRLPYILSLQLKRFDLDYETFDRVKLNDVVKFPFILNLNPFILRGDSAQFYFDPAHEQPEIEVETDQKPTEQTAQPLDYNVQQASTDVPALPSSRPIAEVLDEEVEAIKVSKLEQVALESLQQGENVYELYAVLVHSGSAFSGHYFAYIKSFENSRWYEFNDSIVRRISHKKVVKAFGKPEDAASKSATNAYMLLYRKVTQAGIKSLPPTSIPDYLHSMIAEQQAEDDKRTAELIEKLSNLKVHVYMKQDYKDIAIRTSNTFWELKLKALEEFGLSERPSEDYRLRSYLPYTESMKDVYSDELTLSAVKVYNFMNLCLEERPESGEFQEYDPNKISLKVVVWNDALTPEANIEQPVNAALKVSISLKATFLEVMQVLGELLGCTAEDVLIVKKGYLANDAVIVNPADKWLVSLESAGLFEGQLLFAEKNTGPCKWQAEFLEAGQRISLFFNDPTAPQHAVGNFEYKHSISLNSSTTTTTLKQKLSEKLSLSPEIFVIKVGNKYNSEIRQTDQTLAAAGLVTNTVLHLDPDPASVPKRYNIKLFTGTYCDSLVKDAVFERFELLTQAEVLNYMTVETVKQVVCQQVAQNCPEVILTPDAVQLREMYGNSLGKRLLDKDRIESYSLWEDKAYLLLADPLALKDNDIHIIIKRFYPTSWELSPGKSMVVQYATPMHELGKAIEDMFEIPLDQQEVASSEEIFNFTRLDLNRATWTRLDQAQASVNTGALAISKDFTIVLVKHASEMERELTLEERKLYQPSVQPPPAQWVAGPKPKEAAVTIRVKGRQEAE